MVYRKKCAKVVRHSRKPRRALLLYLFYGWLTIQVNVGKIRPAGDPRLYSQQEKIATDVILVPRFIEQRRRLDARPGSGGKTSYTACSTV